MPRRTAARKSKSERLRALPWGVLLQVVVLVGRRWRALSGKDRARLARLVRDSQGRVSNLNKREQAELRKLLGRLELRGLVGEVLALVRRGRGRRRRLRRARA
jgi:hypothetical protein